MSFFRDIVRFLFCFAVFAGGICRVFGSDSDGIEIWHGDRQRIGHLGTAQPDFNVLGHIVRWRELDTLRWAFNRQEWGWTALSYRAFRRLTADGDFNADIPIASLRPGENTIILTAQFRDGTSSERMLTLVKETGAVHLPQTIIWSAVNDPQDVGQYVDGHWKREPRGLRTAQVGYDRIFLIGQENWRDYEVRTSITVHHVPKETAPHSGSNGVGVLLRFTGHVVGGPNHFPSGQPKWGYLPFGAIGWLRWSKGAQTDPDVQFHRGDGNVLKNSGKLDFALEETYALRMRCTTLPDAQDGGGVTRYDFKVWRASAPEPADWNWRETQASAISRRTGGAALLAHHVDVTFGDVIISGPRTP